MKIRQTPLTDLHLLESNRLSDSRGGFLRCFCDSELSAIIGARRVRQINHSVTAAVGSVRGMHFQYPPYAEMKLIRCLRGRVLDVAVDLRRGSATFLRWHAEELSRDNDHMIVIPEGFAHGFQVLEPDSELLYLHTASYNPEAEGAVHYADPLVAIDWPLGPTDLSERDQNHPLLDARFEGIAL